MPEPFELAEGWYLMSSHDLELELLRTRGRESPSTNAKRLSISDALAYKAAGNLPDELGRTLRLVLHLASQEELVSIDKKRSLFEPDYHDEPTWKRPGSKPINVVPLRSSNLASAARGPWWEQPELKELEDEWSRTGAVAGIAIPAEYRGFIYKTVLSLRAGGREVTVESLLDSIARWLGPHDLASLRSALEAHND